MTTEQVSIDEFLGAQPKKVGWQAIIEIQTALKTFVDKLENAPYAASVNWDQINRALTTFKELGIDYTQSVPVAMNQAYDFSSHENIKLAAAHMLYFAVKAAKKAGEPEIQPATKALASTLVEYGLFAPKSLQALTQIANGTYKSIEGSYPNTL